MTADTGRREPHTHARTREAELLAAALAALDEAAALGDAQARHAAAVLRARRSSGRQPIDDSHLLREVAALSGCGRDAVGIVARRHGSDSKSVAAIARRLRRKLNGQNGFCPRVRSPDGWA